MFWRPFFLILFLFLASYVFTTFAEAHSDGDFFAPWESEHEIMARVKIYDYNLSKFDFRRDDLEILGVDRKNNTADLYLSKEQLKLIKQKGYEILLLEDKNLMLSPDQEYKTAQEIADFLKSVHQRFPEITKLVSIGKSSEGRDIWALKISDNADMDEPGESKILFNGMHHAREVMTPEITTDIVSFLTEGYGSDSKVTAWVENYEIWVVPMLNVDGNNKVWTGNSMWRKNTAYGYGVDINRNYPYKWGSCNGSSGSTYSDTYRGPSAGSENETKALMGLVSTIRPVFDISYHSYSELVIYPYGCEGMKTETHQVVGQIGGEMANLLGYTAGTSWETLYSVDGGDVDWMYGAFQVIPFVIEVNSSNEGFQPNYAKWRNVTVEKNRLGWKLLLNRLSGSGIKGQVKGASQSDLDQGEVVLKVYSVAGGKRTLFQNYKVNPNGSFHVVTNPGTYDLEVVASGRSTQTQSGIVVGNSRVDTDFNL